MGMANFQRVWPTGSLGERFGTLAMNRRTLGEIVAGVHRTGQGDASPLGRGGRNGRAANSDQGLLSSTDQRDPA